MKNAVKMGLLLEFERVFPNENPLQAAEYLHGANKEQILNVAAFFLGFKNQDSKFNNNAYFIETFFREENGAFANYVYSKVLELEAEGNTVGIINAFTSLRLFEIFFQQATEEPTQTAAEFEINLFKAYLVLNSEFTAKQSVAFSSTEELEGWFKPKMMLFCMSYPVSDKTNYSLIEIWTTQLIKAIYLFRFLENTNKSKPLLAAFLQHFDRNTWQDYLKDFIPLTLSFVKNENEAHTDIQVEAGVNFERTCAFLEKLIVQENEELDKDDFLTLRSKPFYKIADGVYRVIFNLFVIEKIFKGAYFILRQINNGLPQPQKVPDLKSFFGDEFSEKILLYEAISAIFKTGIRLSGREIETLGFEGGPDFYIRKGKDILLFESKDFLIPKDSKMSFDFKIYDREFTKKLYYDVVAGQERPKAIVQLINNIRLLLTKQFDPDKNYHYRDVYIYPILVVHDHQYETVWFNSLLNLWFQEELQILEEEGLYVNKVKPVVVINIDTLLYHQVPLTTIPLYEVIKEYHAFVHMPPNIKFKTPGEMQDYFLEKGMSFSTFADNYFNKLGKTELPPILEIVAPVLFEDEYKILQKGV